MDSKKKEKVKKKQSIFQNMKDGWNRFQDLDIKSLKNLRNLLSIALIGDLFLFFWYIKQETIGTFLFILIISFLIIILLAERGKYQEMAKEKKKDKKKKKGKKKKKDFIEDLQENTSDSMRKTVENIQLALGKYQIS